MVATQEQTHKMLYGAGGGRPARGGGGGGGRRGEETLYQQGDPKVAQNL